MTQNQIIDYIRDGTLFGAAEVDISVPEHLRTKFLEMPPIFKNVEISENDIGDYMQEYLRKTKQSFKPTRYLIGSMYGVKILLITPFLKWCIEHGLIVSKVYQVIQFNPKRCFKKFAETISDDRRAGRF